MKFERARTDEQVQERKNEILKACAKLFDEHGVEGVHFKAVGEMTSFTRSSIYKYYNTKEEVLLDLLMDDVRCWGITLKNLIKDQDTLTKEAYAKIITQSFVAHERMLKLMSILTSVLEKNCSVEKLSEFKTKVYGYMAAFPESVDKYFPNAKKEDQETFILTASSFLMGLYPSTNLTEKQIEAMKLAGVYHQISFEDQCYKGLLFMLNKL